MECTGSFRNASPVNLRQLRYVHEIASHDFNISRAAKMLKTNQPGISKQVRMLEEELGFSIFKRRRSRLSGTTHEGEKVIAIAANIVQQIENIRAISHEVLTDRPAQLVIAATHTQARYVLPSIIRGFAARHPNVTITMRHSDPARTVELVEAGMADIGVTSGDPATTRTLLPLPCHEFQKMVIVPKGHPLCAKKRIGLRDLERYPLVNYDTLFTAGRQVTDAFEAAGLKPRMAVIAIGADVIKSCVEQGLGIAVLSEVAFDEKRDTNLRALPAGHLFAPSVTKILLSRDRYIRPYTYDFIELCDPHWTRSRVQESMIGKTRSNAQQRADRTRSGTRTG